MLLDRLPRAEDPTHRASLFSADSSLRLEGPEMHCRRRSATQQSDEELDILCVRFRRFAPPGMDQRISSGQSFRRVVGE